MTVEQLAKTVIEGGRLAGYLVATAESCTGGLIAGALTEVPGSSAVFDRGFVTYSNEAKHEMLGVPLSLIQTKGAVSQEVAAAMVGGALENSNADYAVAVTGVAGPGGGSAKKPVGLVFIAVQKKGGAAQVRECLFHDTQNAETRAKIREETVLTSLTMLLKKMSINSL